MNKEETTTPAPDVRPPLVRWMRRIAFAFLAVLVLLIVVLQFSVVQTWLSSKITTYISESTNTRITAERLRISPFDGIVLQHFAILGEKSDTLLHAGALNISLRKNLFYLINNTLDLSYLGLKDVQLNIVTEQESDTSNLQLFLSKLPGQSGKKSDSAPFSFNVKEVDLSQIKIVIDNKKKGKKEVISLISGTLDINYIDLICLDIDINSIMLNQPVYQSTIYDYACFMKYEEQVLAQTDTVKKAAKPEKEPLTLTMRELDVSNGTFGMSNLLKNKANKHPGSLDFNNFYFEQINVSLRNFSLRNGMELLAKLDYLSARDNTGFEITNFKCDTISVMPRKASLLGFSLAMGNTVIKERLSFAYNQIGDFSDFKDKILIQASLRDSRVQLNDLAHFVGSLSDAAFVRNNGKELIYISGNYFGRVKNISGKNVDIRLGNKLSFAGSFNTRNLTDPDNAILNVRLNRFVTSMRRLKMIFPSFNAPENFYKLGTIQFEGRFDGYLEDFVAFGKLRSDVGTAELDMRLDVSQGTEKANYSGTLNLRNFNLGKWSDNPDFGLVNFNSRVDKGKGLTLQTVNTDLAASIRSLSYKNYTYQDFVLDGVVKQNTFEGVFKIEDDNLDFIFDGFFEYLNGQAFLNFSADLRFADLYALNLTKAPFSVRARMDIDVSGRNLNDFTGNIDIREIHIEEKDSAYALNALTVTSRNLIDGNRELSLASDIGTAQLTGQYDLPNVVRSLKKVIQSNYPYFTKTWKKDFLKSDVQQKFNFEITFEESKNFLSLLGLKNSFFKNFHLKGKLDTYRDELVLASELPFFQLNKDSLNDLLLLVNTNKKKGDISVHIDSTFALGRHFNPIDLQTNLKGDTLEFEFSTQKIIDTLENFDIQGRIIPHSRGYNLTLKDNLLVMLGTRWKINPSNNIVLGEQFFNLENMVFTDGYRSVEINDFNNNRGLSLDINNFNVNIVNEIINYDKLLFKGLLSLSLKVDDVFNNDLALSGYINIPEFSINEERYGSVFINLNKKINTPYNAVVSVGDFLGIRADYDPGNQQLNGKIKLRQAPLEILEYLLKEGIKDTEGYINGDFTVRGPIKDLSLNGEGIVHKGKTKLIYTGASYFFDQQKFRMTSTSIDLTGARITDENGNAGTVQGGLVHNMFKAFGVNATITGNNVIGLNTTKADNPAYYGFGIGRITAEFTGSFEKVDMKINAVTGPGTRLFIPVGNSQTKINQSFIKFVKKDGNGNTSIKKSYAVKGISIEMAMTITPDAELSLIFNEAKGDIIKGRGRGNLKIDVTRQGDFEMFGNYEIEQGQYLFTVAQLPVAKPFVVERGGSIVWTGDPVNATLDMVANYQARTPVKPFIEEYLTIASENTQSLASQRSEVDLKLKLKGTLFKPEIKFDLSFPNLISDLSTLTDSKLRVLRANEDALNSQVMGLIVFNSFLPSNRIADVLGAAGLQSAGINTLSEFLSSQLSLYITNLLNSALEEDGLISGIDFEVGVRNNNLALSGSAINNLFPDEIEVRLKNKFRFMDERFSLNVGGNYVFQNQGIAINQVLPDFALEFLLTEDRKLKVRLYGKYDIDPIAITSLREKYGLGVAYRTEFGSMLDFEKRIKAAVSGSVEK